VAAVLKHWVANDIEHERTAVSSEVSERALREVYMRPFQIAVAEANPLSIMSSYNRVNGVHVGDSKELLDGVLHKEWGWDGMIMSDWFGTYSVDTAILAGQGELRRTLPGIVVADVKRH
jgi:beta-glucosidase